MPDKSTDPTNATPFPYIEESMGSQVIITPEQQKMFCTKSSAETIFKVAQELNNSLVLCDIINDETLPPEVARPPVQFVKIDPNTDLSIFIIFANQQIIVPKFPNPPDVYSAQIYESCADLLAREKTPQGIDFQAKYDPSKPATLLAYASPNTPETIQLYWSNGLTIPGSII